MPDCHDDDDRRGPPPPPCDERGDDDSGSSHEDRMRDRASHADLSPPESPDISKFLTQSDFRVDFSKRRRAVFMVTGYMGVMAGFAYAVPLWGVYRAIERGVPVDPTIGNILEGINTALFINVAAIIGGYLIVPAWEASNFRKNFTDVIRTVGHTSVARTAAKYGGGPSPRDKEG